MASIDKSICGKLRTRYRELCHKLVEELSRYGYVRRDPMLSSLLNKLARMGILVRVRVNGETLYVLSDVIYGTRYSR